MDAAARPPCSFSCILFSHLMQPMGRCCPQEECINFPRHLFKHTLRVCLSQVATKEQLSWSPRLNLGSTFRSIIHNGPRKKEWSVLSGAAGFVDMVYSTSSGEN